MPNYKRYPEGTTFRLGTKYEVVILAQSSEFNFYRMFVIDNRGEKTSIKISFVDHNTFEYLVEKGHYKIHVEEPAFKRGDVFENQDDFVRILNVYEGKVDWMLDFKRSMGAQNFTTPEHELQLFLQDGGFGEAV